MLKNIPKILSPQLVKVLMEMGHGDEIVIADANFPSSSVSSNVIRADGLSGVDLLEAASQEQAGERDCENGEDAFHFSRSSRW